MDATYIFGLTTILLPVAIGALFAGFVAIKIGRFVLLFTKRRFLGIAAMVATYVLLFPVFYLIGYTVCMSIFSGPTRDEQAGFLLQTTFVAAFHPLLIVSTYVSLFISGIVVPIRRLTRTNVNDKRQ